MSYDEIFERIYMIDRKLDFVCNSAAGMLIYIEYLPDEDYEAIKKHIQLLDEKKWYSILNKMQKDIYDYDMSQTLQKIFENGLLLQNLILQNGFHIKDLISKRGVEFLHYMLSLKNPLDFYPFAQNRRNWSKGEILYYMEKHLLRPELLEYAKTELFSQEDIKEYKVVKLEKSLESL